MFDITKKQYTPAEIEVNRTLWVEALESGDYTQTKSALRDNIGYCCLGVACAVLGVEVTEDVYDSGVTNYSYLGEYSSLPEPVMLALGMATNWGELNESVTTPEPGWGSGVGKSLMGLNDSVGYTFQQIADVIKAKPAGLFNV